MYYNNQIINPQLWSNGPTPGGLYNFTGGFYNEPSTNENLKPYTAPGPYGTQRQSTPITTGTSVVGIKYDKGVMIASDNLVSYGSLARYQNVERVFKINNRTVLGAGGDYADFQSLKRTIDQKIIEDISHNDNIEMKPKALYSWLTRVFYNRRSRMNPLWLDIVVGGLDENDVPFLGHVDLRGRSYEEDVVVTGLGKHLALPIVRERLVNGKLMNQAQASDALRKCMEVLYYRDCRTIPKYSVAVVSKEGSIVQGPLNVNENWNVASFVKGY